MDIDYIIDKDANDMSKGIAEKIDMKHPDMVSEVKTVEVELQELQ